MDKNIKSMKLMRRYCLLPFLILLNFLNAAAQKNLHSQKEKIIIQVGLTENYPSSRWNDAIRPRLTQPVFDSISRISHPISPEEALWIDLVNSKLELWNSWKDSLEKIFSNSHGPDTIYVLLGFSAIDDAFTFQYNTVCFDIAAIQKIYGAATTAENNQRIDRFFAHEYMHLLHKEWARQRNLRLENFRDSVLWECLYEGVGMYRSLSQKWLPIAGKLPSLSLSTLEQLYPEFVNNLVLVKINDQLSTEEKNRIQARLSRGPVNQKWGALPMGLWLAMEAAESENKLVEWNELGLDGVIKLALKYLPEEYKVRLQEAYLKK